ASNSDCSVVGYYYNNPSVILNGGAYQTLIEHWDGDFWGIISSPNINPSDTTCISSGQSPGCIQPNVISSIGCAPDSTCWAVGYYTPADGTPVQSLIERWDGTTWTTASTVSPPDVSYVFGVTCLPNSDCWAV